MHTDIHTRIHTHTHANTCKHTHTRTQTNTHTLTHIHMPIHTNRVTHTHTLAHVLAHTNTNTHNVLSWSEIQVLGTTCRTMSRRLDSSSLSSHLKRSYLVNRSKYRVFKFVTVPSTLFDLFVLTNSNCIVQHSCVYMRYVWNTLKSNKIHV